MESIAESETSVTTRVRIDLAYDGFAFSGWAKQPGLVTVQGVLEEALEMLFRTPIFTTVAGRTDAGVHALHQVVHIDVDKVRWQQIPGHSGDTPAVALPRKLRGALSRVLVEAERHLEVPRRLQGLMQKAITVQSAAEVSPHFDARFSALERSYRYLIEDNFLVAGSNPLTRHITWQVNKKLDLEVMNRAALELVGLHDFLSFCKPREGASTVRELREVSFSRTEEELIEAKIRADAFCHNMVRTLIAALVMVGEGTKSPGWLRERIASPVRDSQVRLAPPRGLALAKISYPAPELYSEQATRARAIRSLAVASQQP